MLHERGSLVLIAVVCLVASPARAQAPDEPRIDLSVVDVPLARAVADVAARGGGSVVVDRRVAEERVTADLRGVTWREAVDVLARLTRSRVEARPSGVLLVGPGTVRVSAAFEDADVRSVLRTLVERFDEPLWVD
ncbi:MAG: hypothetical protein KIT58_24270, partial [Planctomycetota bacterium]|nr:hypothetical protein [Planctomycetota bacterium]